MEEEEVLARTRGAQSALCKRGYCVTATTPEARRKTNNNKKRRIREKKRIAISVKFKPPKLTKFRKGQAQERKTKKRHKK